MLLHEIADKQISASRLPSETCLLCGKRLEEISGLRIIAQRRHEGIRLSEKFLDGGNPDNPYRSVKLHEGAEVYVTVWGKENKWTKEILHKAREEYRKGYRPWFCQICGNRVCSKCGSPQFFPMGTDIMDDSGSVSHVPILALPINPGCTNPSCERNKR